MGMCWSRYPSVPRHHAHEAFKRLLLKDIVWMTTMANDPILTEGSRPLPSEMDKKKELLCSQLTSRSTAIGTTATGSAVSMITTGESHRKRKRAVSTPEHPADAKQLRSSSI
ncbi:hypothetical protein M422DRAFT_34192, partial [Sphaerobolus stellatus SS14]